MNINKALNRIAFFLIALLLILIALSAVIPQQDIASGQIADWQELLGENYAVIEKLGLDRIYYTPTFFIALALLGLSMLYGNVRRFRSIQKAKSNRFRVRYLGSIIFHLSLLVIIAGIILNFLYKYEGVLALTEGQETADRPTEYFREFKGPLYKGEYNNFSLKLDSLRRMPDATDPGGIAAISLFPARGDRQAGEISINHPFKWQDIEFHISQKIGYSPEIHLMDTTGNTVFRAFMRVALVEEDDREINRDFVLIPEQNLELGVEVISSGEEGGTFKFPITAHREDRMLYENTLALGDTAQFADLKLILPRIRNWCYIGVVKGPYLNLVFFGFWTALSGMALGLASRIISTDRKS